MSIQKVVVDTESYQWVPGGSLTVQGWKAERERAQRSWFWMKRESR